jgi:predicted small metal-binding protein
MCCDYVVKGETEEELLKIAGQHAVEHGYNEEDIMKPELIEKVRTHMHKS